MSEKISVKKNENKLVEKKWKQTGQDLSEVEICRIDEIQKIFQWTCD